MKNSMKFFTYMWELDDWHSDTTKAIKTALKNTTIPETRKALSAALSTLEANDECFHIVTETCDTPSALSTDYFKQKLMEVFDEDELHFYDRAVTVTVSMRGPLEDIRARVREGLDKIITGATKAAIGT